MQTLQLKKKIVLYVVSACMLTLVACAAEAPADDPESAVSPPPDVVESDKSANEHILADAGSDAPWLLNIASETDGKITVIARNNYEDSEDLTVEIRRDLMNRLPEGLASADGTTAQYVVFIDYRAYKEGAYENGGGVGYRIDAIVNFYDVSTGKKVDFEKTFEGGPPPPYVTGSGEKYYGDAPSEAGINEYVLSVLNNGIIADKSAPDDKPLDYADTGLGIANGGWIAARDADIYFITSSNFPIKENNLICRTTLNGDPAQLVHDFGDSRCSSLNIVEDKIYFILKRSKTIPGEQGMDEDVTGIWQMGLDGSAPTRIFPTLSASSLYAVNGSLFFFGGTGKENSSCIYNIGYDGSLLLKKEYNPSVTALFVNADGLYIGSKKDVVDDDNDVTFFSSVEWMSFDGNSVKTVWDAQESLLPYELTVIDGWVFFGDFAKSIDPASPYDDAVRIAGGYYDDEYFLDPNMRIYAQASVADEHKFAVFDLFGNKESFLTDINVLHVSEIYAVGDVIFIRMTVETEENKTQYANLYITDSDWSDIRRVDDPR